MDTPRRMCHRRRCCGRTPLWLIMRPYGSLGMSVRFDGLPLGVVDDVDGLEFVSDDGNVAIGMVRREGCAVRVLVEV